MLLSSGGAAPAAFGLLAAACVFGALSAPAPTGSTRAPDARPVDLEHQMSMVTLRAGRGRVASSGDRVTVRSTGSLAGGEPLGAPDDGSEEIEFVLGRGAVIPGWDEGVVGMREGEKRRLVVPPGLGYGARGRTGTRANAPLVFVIELMAIEGEGDDR